MSNPRVLHWDGVGAVTSSDAPAGDGDAALRVTCTLLETGAQVRALAARGGLVGMPGSDVVVRTGAAANRLHTDRAGCADVRGTPPHTGLLLPWIADAVAGMDAAHTELGWQAIVVGPSLHADVLLLLAPNAGCRSIVSVRPPDAPALVTPVAHDLRDAPGTIGETLAGVVAELRGPVVAFDTTGAAAWIQACLAALPNESTLVLFGAGADRNPGSAPVNFYRDVHRKNVRILGLPPAPDPDVWTRARRLLEHGHVDLASLDVAVATATPGATPDTRGNHWLVLDWDS